MKNYQKSRSLKNRKGSAMVLAIIVFLIVMIFGTSVTMIFSNNLNQAKRQEYMAEAYYLAYSGIELAFSSLSAPDADEDPNEYFNYLSLHGSLPTGIYNPQTISHGRGTITIEVDRIDDTDSVYNGWIRIESTGTLTSNGISRTRVIYIDPEDTRNTFWGDD